jgi:hypothetical protein
MRAFAGQVVRHAGRWLHRLVQLALALVVLAAVALGALSWRLAQAPLELPWLARRLEAAANADDRDLNVRIGGAALAWRGLHLGVDRPLDIHLTDITATDAAGAPVARVPRAEVTMSIGWLLLGRIVPRAVEVEGARLDLKRDAAGAVPLDLGGIGAAAAGGGPADVSATLHALARPPTTDRSPGPAWRWSQLRQVRIHDAQLAVEDAQLGTWRAPSVEIDLRRQARGGVEGSADIALEWSGQHARLTASAALDQDARSSTVQAELTPLVPAAFAPLTPALAPLAALDAPVALKGSVRFDADLMPTHLRAEAEIGAGTVHIAQGTSPLLDATVEVEGTPTQLMVQVPRLTLAPTPDGPRTVLQGLAQVDRPNASAPVQVTAVVDLDQVAFADLPALWPAGTGGRGTRPWITQNITAGTLRNGHVQAALRLSPDLTDADLTALSGGIDGKDLTFSWLRPVPPFVHADARLAMLTPDEFVISLASGRQVTPGAAANATGGVMLRGGKVRLTGLAGRNQFADIDADLAGPLADLLAVLRHPRMKLLDKRPLPMRDPAGQFTGKLTVTHLPLRNDLAIDDLQIRTDMKLTGVHLGGIAAGQDLDHGDLELRASNDGLQVAGTAQLAGTPTQLQAEMDFRAGPPAEVLETASVTGTVDERQLASFGLDSGGVLSGPVGLAATLQQHRDGRAEITVNADFARAGLTVARLAWAKPPGQPASGTARLLLDQDRLTAIEQARIQGEGIDVEAAADCAGGQIAVLRLRRAMLGKNTDAQGTIRVPHQPGEAWLVSLAGPSIDLSAEFSHRSATEAARKPEQETAGRPRVVDARFDRVVLGEGHAIQGVAAHAENDGRLTRKATVTGRTAAGASFQATIEPQAGGRQLDATTADAGGLLRAFDVLDDMQGGQLTLKGRFDDTRPEHPLQGTAEISDFRMRNTPGLAKLLQGMTLYGLVDTLRGPGLGFARLVAPFRLAGDVLDITDARAFNSSLGLTAKGSINLARRTADAQGTIVPAYFFNSLLGQIPFVGQLLSPERGGGLFAAAYTVSGSLDDPTVRINPLATLTPGFLRGVFGLFDGKPGQPDQPAGPSR